MGSTKDLYEFLFEAELQHYYSVIKNQLKILNVNQLKYAEEEDLQEVGMSKPEIRRLRKFYKKECPQGALGKIKKKVRQWTEETADQPPSSNEEKIMRSSSDISTRSPDYRDRSGSDISATSPRKYTRQPSKHIIQASNLQVTKTLGVGEFGVVQAGVWTNDEGKKIQVAIKTLSKERMQHGVADFLKEATMMHTIDHENIVRLYGVVLDNTGGESSLMLVTELAPLQSLLDCLKDPNLASNFPITVLAEFASQVGEGMAYLEGRRLIHRDLAARNILVFAKNKVKISDFGLSRALGVGKDYYQTNFNVNLKLPIAWCAPESINYLRFTSASDVWAFGVTLWEMFSYGLQPWASLNGQQLSDSSSFTDTESETSANSIVSPSELAKKILEAIDEPNCQRLEQPDCCPKEFYGLMLKCWEHDPKRRPTFAELRQMIPQLRPEQVCATRDFSSPEPVKDFLFYKQGDVVTVLDKKPHNPPSWNLWKGVMNTSRTGFFEPTDFKPYIEIKTVSPAIRTRLSRKESHRKSARKSKLTAEMISNPQNDLRHTGHIGYDGTMFGDVAFIGDQYDKLPVKVVTPYKPQNDMNNASPTLSVDLKKSNMSDNASDSQWTISSLESTQSSDHNTSNKCSDTLTNGKGGTASNGTTNNGDRTPSYSEIEDGFDDFKMPDFSDFSASLDFGGSLMDDILKALDEKKDTSESNTTDDTFKVEVEPASSSSTSRSSPEKETRSSSEREVVASSPGFSSDDQLIEDESEGKKKKDSTKRKSKLRLMMSRQDSKPEGKKQATVKPLSASEERKLESAIAMAQEIAQEQLTPKSPKTPNDFDDDLDTPRRTKFSFKFPTKKTSPTPEKRTFSDEIAKTKATDFNEDLTPEAQLAYNLLVVKGSVKDKQGAESYRRKDDDAPVPMPRSSKSRERTDSESRRSPRQLDQSPRAKPRIDKEFVSGPRLRIESPIIKPTEEQESPPPPLIERDKPSIVKLEHSPVLNRHSPRGDESPRLGEDSSDRRSVTSSHSIKHSRERRVQRSIEHQRRSSVNSEEGERVTRNLKEPAGIPSRDNGHSEEGSVNPLKMLRAGGGVFVPGRGSGRRQMARSSVHDAERPRGSRLEVDLNKDESKSADNLRHGPRGAAIPQSKYFKKFQEFDEALHRSGSSGSSHSDSLDKVGAEKEISNPLPLPPRKPSRPSTLNQKPRERKYPLVTETSSQDAGRMEDKSARYSKREIERPNYPAPPPPIAKPEDDDLFSSESDHETAHSPTGLMSKAHIALRHVTVDPLQAGMYDNLDRFWNEYVDFEGDMKYKTADSVSYEDLLDFALDDNEKRRIERFRNCPEVESMQRVLGKQVSVNDCLQALDDTKWDVHSAIKYIKLKMLISVQLGDMNRCKDALLKCDWNIESAANYMLSHPEPSPECVDV